MVKINTTPGQITRYGLRHRTSSVLAGVDAQGNREGEFCVSTSYTISARGDETWLVEDVAAARYARAKSTEWYNAVYATPEHDRSFNPTEWEIVVVAITVVITAVDTASPTERPALSFHRPLSMSR